MSDKDITNNENGFGSPEKGEKSKGGKGKRKGRAEDRMQERIQIHLLCPTQRQQSRCPKVSRPL